jgi:RNA polymerase sigma factor (sigma-70 family)
MAQSHSTAYAGRDGPPSERSAPPSEDAVAAFLERLAPHVPAVLRVATTLVGAADAEDAAQEALVRAWQANPDPRDLTAPRAWLLRIAINLCADWRRGRFGTRQRVTQSLDASGASALLATVEFDPGTSDHTGALDLRRAINRLEPDLRLVVALRYYACLDSVEIGHLLDVPGETVRTRLRRALTLLRAHLAAPRPQPHDANANDAKGGCS